MRERGSHRLLEQSQTDGVAAERHVRSVALVDVTRHIDDCFIEWLGQAAQRIKVQVHRFGQGVRERLHLMQSNVDAAVKDSQAREDAPLMAAFHVDSDTEERVVLSHERADRHLREPLALIVHNVKRFIDAIEHHSHHLKRDNDQA